ncbi:MAG: histidinol dehydrogenase [Candidatus Izemoplasma sp.]|nr:histidinol dehydrogenase [Candidatus Izemoplasma sp.]
MLTQILLEDLEETLDIVNQNVEEETRVVKEIIKNIRLNGDLALKAYTKKFDHVSIQDFRVSDKEINDAYNRCSKELIDDLKTAYQNITLFHEAQISEGYKLSVSQDSYVGQKVVPIQEVGLYVPGGTAAYPSTVLMNAAPAKIAGVKRIVMISPPDKKGNIKDIILAAAKVAGIDEVYRCGGAQGVAALAYGTESIQPVNKIVGPGNIFVALAKKEVFGKVGIDMIAGPSEILVYAEASTNPEFVAADLLSQAEHDIRARSILVSTSQSLIDQVNKVLRQQTDKLERKAFIEQALKTGGMAILVDDDDEAIEVINQVAPEHLELLTDNAEALSNEVINAGAIFIGPYSPEPLGDYIAGPNHTLPTSGTATFSQALGVDDFVKKMSLIKYSKENLFDYKDSIMRLADIEGLTAHKNAIKVRYDEN